MGYFPKAVTNPSSFAGADLKEREQMNEVEVGVFVQRLRGLMDEIGKGPGMGQRRAFRSPADPSPIHHALKSKVSVWTLLGFRGRFSQRPLAPQPLCPASCPFTTPNPFPKLPSLKVQAWLFHRSHVLPARLSGFDSCCSFCLNIPP